MDRTNSITTPDDLMGLEIEELIDRCADLLTATTDKHEASPMQQGTLFPIIGYSREMLLRQAYRIVARVRANEIVEYARCWYIMINHRAVRILPFKTCHAIRVMEDR